MPDNQELFTSVDFRTGPRDDGCASPISRHDPRRRPTPARTVLRRSLWERHFAAQGDQLIRLAANVARLERKLDIEHKQSVANAETLALTLRKLTQLGHDLHLRETPRVPVRHSRKRPLG